MTIEDLFETMRYADPNVKLEITVTGGGSINYEVTKHSRGKDERLTQLGYHLDMKEPREKMSDVLGSKIMNGLAELAVGANYDARNARRQKHVKPKPRVPKRATPKTAGGRA